MSYLTPGDYKKTIQADNLQQVIGSDPTILADAEETAVEEAQSHLVQKYLIAQEFADTPAWDAIDTYHALDRVYLDAPAWSSTPSYAIGVYVSYLPTGAKELSIYKSNTAGTTIGTFIPSEWTFINYRYSIYNAPAPKPVFNYKTIYNIGDQVFWKDKVYTCIIPSTNISQSQALQYLTYNNIPYANVFPDDQVNGVQYWGAGVVYTIAANTDILNAKWAVGDNRSKQVVKIVVDIVLYYIHDRIAPRNIPELRVKNYDDSIKKLKKFAEGDTTNIKLPYIQPVSGARIRWGGNVKSNNSY